LSATLEVACGDLAWRQHEALTASLAPGDFAEVKDFSAMDNSKQWYNNGLSQIEDNSSYVFSYFLLWGDSSL